MSDPGEEIPMPGSSDFLASEEQSMEKGIGLGYEVGQGDAELLLQDPSVFVEQVPVQPDGQDLIQTPYDANTFTSTLNNVSEFPIEAAGIEYGQDTGSLYEGPPAQLMQDDCLTNPINTSPAVPVGSTEDVLVDLPSTEGLILSQTQPIIEETIFQEETPAEIVTFEQDLADGGFAMESEAMEVEDTLIPAEAAPVLATDSAASTEFDNNLLQSGLVQTEMMETEVADRYSEAEPEISVTQTESDPPIPAVSEVVPEVEPYTQTLLGLDEVSQGSATEQINTSVTDAGFIGDLAPNDAVGLDEIDSAFAAVPPVTLAEDMTENSDSHGSVPVLEDDPDRHEQTENLADAVTESVIEEGSPQQEVEPSEDKALESDDVPAEEQLDEVSLIPEMDKDTAGAADVPTDTENNLAVEMESAAEEVIQEPSEVLITADLTELGEAGVEQDTAEEPPQTIEADQMEVHESEMQIKPTEPVTITEVKRSEPVILVDTDNDESKVTEDQPENNKSAVSDETDKDKAEINNDEMQLKISEPVTITDLTAESVVLVDSAAEESESLPRDKVETEQGADAAEDVDKVEISSEASTPGPHTQENGADTEMAIKINDVQGSTDNAQSVSPKEKGKIQEKSVPSPVVVEDDDVAVVGTEKIAVNRHKSTDSSGSSKSTEGKESKRETKEAKTTSDKKESSKQIQKCIVCKKVGKCKYNIVRNGDIKHLCDDECFKIFRAKPTSYLRPDADLDCDFCKKAIKKDQETAHKFKFTLPNNSVKLFCNDHCQTMFLKADFCHYCGKNYNKSFMAGSVRGVRKLFCSSVCIGKLHKMHVSPPTDDDDVEIVGTSQVTKKPAPVAVQKSAPVMGGSTRQIICTVCKEKKSIKHEVSFNRKMHSLCSDKCFAAFRYANKLTMSPCDNCGAFCSDPSSPGSNTETIQFEGRTKKFCGSNCLNTFKTKNKKIKQCAWCNNKKSIFEMVERVDANNKVQLFCSLNCLSLYRVNLQATSNQQVKCDQCNNMAPAQYHLTMSDASVRNFCSYACVISFQSQFSQPNKSQKQNIPMPNTVAGLPQINQAGIRSTRQSARVAARSQTTDDQDSVPIISDVVSLAHATNPNVTPKPPEIAPVKQTRQVSTGTVGTVTQHIIIEPPKPKQVRNKSLLCKPYCQTKATSCRPHTQNKETQTMDLEPEVKQVLIPVPVPIYMPTPMAMYSAPVPYPLPIPVPIPIPCFIPTTKKSADSILKHIEEIQERMPADPFEAELLMMAEAVATADKSASENSDTDEDEGPPLPTTSTLKAEPMTFEQPEPPPAPTNELGEDMLQMALRMASEISEEPVLDLEDSLNPTPIQPATHEEASEFSTIDHSSDILTPSPRGRRGRRGRGRGRPKRARYQDSNDTEPEEPVDLKPAIDANMVLKYTYGVNAWKHWVVQKNSLLEKATSSSRRKLKLFKTDLLACTADELNYSLCLFVKEVRKPNGEEYACDSIFYLCLGIQQYLYENGRIDNIFTDLYYDRFTECLNEVLLNYEVRLNAQGLIVCRIEEEHLWESKQLGAHSPYILLNTLIYFNTKFFHLKSPEDHIRLSFSHIMKHWKRANGQPVSSKAPAQSQGAKSVYLRYYAPVPHSGPESGQKRKREEAPVFEQGENTDNPLRCPVKLYEFYLSKCPESIKNRNDVFYLVPERSCVPDSPVWYSTGALSIETMNKMLNRLRVVREIQETYLHIDHNMYMS